MGDVKCGYDSIVSLYLYNKEGRLEIVRRFSVCNS